MMMSGKDFLKSWRPKVDWEDVTSSGKAFQVFGPVTGNARLPMVDRLNDGTRRRLVPENCVLSRAVQGTAVHFREEL